MRRRKRLVRVHFAQNEPSSIEGLFIGFWAGHYVVRIAKVLESADVSYSLDGEDVAIPKDRVLFMQRLSQ